MKQKELMGSEFQRFHNQRNTFLPMLCSRPSIKDVGLPIRCVNRRPPSPASSSGDDPLSPRISCIGQVKRNNRIIGFPTSHHPRSLLTNTTLITTSRNTKNDSHSHVVKYPKLKKLFSSKNLTTATVSNPSAAAVSGAGGRGRRRRQVVNGENGSCRSESKSENCVSEIIDVVNMDPPLPVIKRPARGQEEESESLWKRRSGGVAIRGLELQKIHHPRHHLQPTTV